MNSIQIEQFRINSIESFFGTLREKAEKINILWIGQAGFILSFREKIFIIDPYLSDYLAKKYEGKIFPHTRLMDIPISPQSIKSVDYILCTHSHSDHMDPETVSVLSNNNPKCKFIVSTAEIEEAVKRGIDRKQILDINANQTIDLEENIKIKAIAACHEDFKINEKGEYSYLGYIFQLGKVRIYHSGDCIPYKGLSEDLKRLKVNIALLPINGRDEYRLNKGIAGNFTIAEVLKLCKDANINILIVHHFGMFAYNTVKDEDLINLKGISSPSLEIIIPEINIVYKVNLV